MNCLFSYNLTCQYYDLIEKSRKMCYRDLAAKYWHIVFYTDILQSILGSYPCYFLTFMYLEYKGGLYHEGVTSHTKPGFVRNAAYLECLTWRAAMLPEICTTGLSALQHRGQESCGIAVCDTNGPKGVVNCYKGLDLSMRYFMRRR